MKALVTYYSQTGNTEKLARAIYKAIHVEKKLLPIEELKSVEGYDIIFVGFPVQAHSVPAARKPNSPATIQVGNRSSASL